MRPLSELIGGYGSPSSNQIPRLQVLCLNISVQRLKKFQLHLQGTMSCNTQEVSPVHLHDTKCLNEFGRPTRARPDHWKSLRLKQLALSSSLAAFITMKLSDDSFLGWVKNGIKLSWKSLGNFTSQTNRPARSLRINCTSTDLPLTCMLPRIAVKRSKLKHQNAWTGPQSITQSFKWQWRCMFGVTDFLPYITVQNVHQIWQRADLSFKNVSLG